MGRTVLTDAAVRRIAPPMTGRIEVWDAALPGFGVRITASDRRSFVLMTRVAGRPVRVTLGSYPATPLATARKRARAALDVAAAGDDPRAPKRDARAADSLAVERLAAQFVEKWAKVRNRTWPETERHLTRYVLPAWKGRRLDRIARQDVVALVAHVADAHGPIMANRVLATVKKWFSWSLDQGLLDVHPVARLTGPGAETARDHVLTDSDLSQLWKAWTAMAYPWGIAFQLLALTAARRGEVEAMRWDEIGDSGRLWTLPGSRMKGKRAHVVPLSDPAVALLRGVPRFEGCPYVFTTRGAAPIRDWSGAVEAATEQSGVTGWRTHDLRRTARTGLAKLGVPADIAERVLGHVMPGVRGVYDRHDYLAEKRDALERWAGHLTMLVRRDG